MSSMLWDTPMGRGLKLLRNFLPGIIGYGLGVYFALQYLSASATCRTILGGCEGIIWLMPFYYSAIAITLGIFFNFLWIYILAKRGVD